MPLSDQAPGYSRHVRGLAMFVTGYAIVDLLPVVLPGTPVFKGLRISDLADLALLFVLAALYVQLGLRANLYRSGKLRVAFATALAMMVQGHSIHRAGDAIAAASGRGDGGWALIYFLDEHWGHLELHLSFLIVAALFIGCASPASADLSGRPLSRTEMAGLRILIMIYGFLLAGDAIEGQTVQLMLPAAIALSLWGFWPYLRYIKRPTQPVVSLYRRFFASSFAVATVALVVYGLVNGGFPELTALGSAAR